MPEKIRFQKNVPSDIDFLLEHYTSENTTNRVRSTISRTFELIEMFPRMYAVAFDDIRLVKTKGYPILIQFRLLNETPVVLSVYFSGEPDVG